MEHSTIERLRFSTAGDRKNQLDSVALVDRYTLLDASSGLPIPGGCHDERLGGYNYQFQCKTCGHSKRECLGHFGTIHTPFPVESPAFIAEIRKWLRVLCLGCGAPVVDPARVAAEPLGRRLAEAAKLVKTGKPGKPGPTCTRCGAVHPKIVKSDEDYFSFYAEDPGGERRSILPTEIRAVFGMVADETVAAFGRPNHPRTLVLTQIPVPPNTIRPGMRMGLGPGGSASTHDTTNLIQHFLRNTQQLPGQVPDVITPKIEKIWSNSRLLYHSQIIGVAKNSAASHSSTGRRSIVLGSRPTNSIMRGLARKRGRFRKNLAGKRVWSIVRSTISGNPYLGIDQVGLPVAFARTVQIVETVTEHSRARLLRYFLNGSTRYPGCTRVWKRAKGQWHYVSGATRGFHLDVGDRIERDVITGDLGYFGRAPSLERSSLGVHEIVVLLDPAISTIQMNVLATPWYNADFDGDAMNLWVPRHQMARIEAYYLSRVHNWFISTKSSGPVIGQIQDSVVGSLEVTRHDAVVDKYHAMRAFALVVHRGSARPNFAAGGAAARYPGRELVSQLFATTPVNYAGKPKWYDPVIAPFVDYVPDETHTRMERGRLVSGVLDKKSVGASAAGGLFHRVSREYGARSALEKADGLQKIAIAFLESRGFTMSAADIMVPPAHRARIAEVVASVVRESELISEKLVRGELIPPIGMTTRDWYEHLQRQALKISPAQILEPILTAVNINWNGFVKMILAGSKGNAPNLINIMGGIGSTEINGLRIPERFCFRRTCVYFPRFSTSPFASGFIAGCYRSGLSGVETIFAAMHGRFDLINKALTTATTGYSNRKLVMSFQSDVVNNFRALAKDDTRVVQFLSGEDGVDTRSVQPVTLRTVFLSDDELRERYRYESADAAHGALFEGAFRRVVADRDAFRETQLFFEDAGFEDPLTATRTVPVNVAQIVENVVTARDPAAEAPAPKPAEVAEMQRLVDGFCATLGHVYANEETLARARDEGADELPEYLHTATTLLQMFVRSELAAPVLATLARAELLEVLDATRLAIVSALIDAGTAAGILAAQAISEPLTQYMLDSHHRSVKGGTSKAGIERPTEIFGAKSRADEKTSEMMIRLRPEHERDRARATQVANQIELIALSRFVLEEDILYERLDDLVYPTFVDDQAWIAEFAKYHPLLPTPGDLTRWCLRLVLNKATMVLKSMSLERIVDQLRARHPETYVVHSPENAPQILLRIYLRAGWFARGAVGEGKAIDLIRKQILPTPIRGIAGIESASVVEKKRHFLQPDGSLALEKVFAVHAKGTNIAGVLENPLVDPARVVSSSIGDTFEMYGTVAAQMAIVRELKRVMGDSTPNERHLTLCAAEIMLTGKPTPLELSGVRAREPHNVMLSSVFGDPTGRLTSAALAGADGRLCGAVPYLAVGTAPRVGSRYNDVVVDPKIVAENCESVESLVDGLLTD